MQVLNYSTFRKNLREKLEQVTDNDELVIVNRTDDKAIVVMSLAEYNSWQETMHLLRSEKNRLRLVEAINRTEQDIFEQHQLRE